MRPKAEPTFLRGTKSGIMAWAEVTGMAQPAPWIKRKNTSEWISQDTPHKSDDQANIMYPPQEYPPVPDPVAQFAENSSVVVLASRYARMILDTTAVLV